MDEMVKLVMASCDVDDEAIVAELELDARHVSVVMALIGDGGFDDAVVVAPEIIVESALVAVE